MSFIVPANFRQLPPVWELSQPFRIAAVGNVSYDTDPAMWAMNHILALLLTTAGERVMRPTYGAGVRNFVFENNDPFVEGQMLAKLQNDLATWEPNITLHEIKLEPQPPDWGTMDMKISFSVGRSPTPYTLQFNIGGQGIEVQSR